MLCSCKLPKLHHCNLASFALHCIHNYHLRQIDLDTIETSNLNRQFLFRRKHVGESKAKVAAEAVQRFRPKARITAHQVRPKLGAAFTFLHCRLSLTFGKLRKAL